MFNLVWNKRLLLLGIFSSVLFIAGCDSDDDETVVYTEEFADADFTATDWTEATHSKDADPDFTEVFDDTQVKRFDFVITEERWQAMLDNMTDIIRLCYH